MVPIHGQPLTSEVSVGIKPYKEWPKGKTKADLIQELAKDYKDMPFYRWFLPTDDRWCNGQNIRCTQ